MLIRGRECSRVRRKILIENREVEKRDRNIFSDKDLSIAVKDVDIKQRYDGDTESTSRWMHKSVNSHKCECNDNPK